MQSGDWSDVQIVQIKDHHGYELIGHSVASRHTSIAVPLLGVVFDMGICSNSSMLQDTVLISHGHLDHIATLPNHALDRLFHRHTKPTYVLTFESAPGFEQMFKGVLLMSEPKDLKVKKDQDTSRFFNQVLVTDQHLKRGDAVLHLPKGGGKKYFVKAYEMAHTVPAVAFLVFEIKKKLKAEYQGLETKEIAELARAGKEVSDTFEIPLIAYTGDTEIIGVLQHPDLLSAETLLIECTYIQTQEGEDSREGENLGGERGHIHENDIIEAVDLFQNREIVLFHFSMRYKEEQIRAAEARIQAVFGDRLKVTAFI